MSRIENEPCRLDFASDDYLGFSTHPLIRQRIIDFLATSPLAVRSSLIGETEEFLASTFGSEAALIFDSGYMANLGVLSALGGEGVEFFSDELNHASLVDGIRLARSEYKIFSHNNLQQLRDLLKASSAPHRVIVTESIFSMDGDHAPLAGIQQLAREFNACLVVDEAHATGIYGERFLGLTSPVENVIAVHTGGNALGASGAFATMSRSFKSFFLSKARSMLFATALSPLSIVHLRFAVEELLRDSKPAMALNENVVCIADLLRPLGLGVHSHIIPYIISGETEVQWAEEYLGRRGFYVKAIQAPTVAKGMERLRLTVKSFHKASEIEELIYHLEHVTP